MAAKVPVTPQIDSTDIQDRLELTPRAVRRRRTVRWLSGLAVVALLAVGAFAAVRSWPAEAVGEYQTGVVERGSLTVTVTATGELESRTQVEVGTEISGIVETVYVDYNSHVKAGQLLATINTDKLQAQAAQARASLQSARADVTSAEAASDDARRTFDRARALFEAQLISRSDLDTAEASARRSDASRASAMARVAQAEASLAAIESDLGKADIQSPITGIVLDRQVDPGQTVAAAFQTPVLFTLAEDLTRMKLSVDVDEADVGSVAVGQAATFRVDAYPDRTFASEVTDIRSTPTTQNGVVTYETILTVENDERLLRPGMTATAEIVVTTIDGALLVPNAALRFEPASAPTPGGGRGRGGLFFLPRPPGLGGGPPVPETDGSRIWVLDGVEPVPVAVTTGPTDGSRTVVTAGDLAPGTPVITDVVQM